MTIWPAPTPWPSRSRVIRSATTGTRLSIGARGDYDNAHYWFGRVGPVPILARIYGHDPAGPRNFVERCRAARGGSDAALEQFQRDEMAHLLAHALSHEPAA